MGKRLTARLRRLAVRYPRLFEFIKFNIVSLCTGVIDYAVTLALLWGAFRGLFDIPVRFWIFVYPAGRGNGLALCLAASISYVVSQVFNFCAQRRVTFRANNSVARSAVCYALVTLTVLVIINYLPQFYTVWLYGLVGEEAGALIVKLLNGTISFVVMYPVSKFYIMRRRPGDGENRASNDAEKDSQMMRRKT